MFKRLVINTSLIITYLRVKETKTLHPTVTVDTCSRIITYLRVKETKTAYLVH